MSRSYVNILLTIFLAQKIVAQLSPVTWNGCQNCQSINSQPETNGNFNNGFVSDQQNGFGQQSVYGQQNGKLLNELQSIPKLSFVNGQITDLIDFASKINKRQLTDNNNNALLNNLPNNPCSQLNCLDQVNNNQQKNVPITFFPNTVVQNNVNKLQSNNIFSQGNSLNQDNKQITNLPITFFPNTVFQNNLNNVLPSTNNLCSQVNCLNQGNNQLNNVPINFYPNLNSGIQNNLVPNNVVPSNSAQNNPIPNFVPNAAVPISFYPNTALNNVIPTSVLNNIPNNVADSNGFPIVSNVSPCNNGINTDNYEQNLPAPYSNSLVDLPKINSLILTGDACNNGQPFSVLPANSFNAPDFSIYKDIVDNGYKITRSLPTETGSPANLENNVIPVKNNNAYNEAAIPLQNKIIGKLIPANNNMANIIQDASLNNGQLALIHNNIYNKQLNSNQHQLVNQWQAIANQNNHNIPTATNWPAINTGSQLPDNVQPEINNNFNLPETVNIPDAANYNLPDLANINMLNLGELGTLPIFSGLPVIGITETVSVIDPEQLYQNHVY